MAESRAQSFPGSCPSWCHAVCVLLPIAPTSLTQTLLSFGALTAPTVAPSGLSGGGGAPNELIITWTVSWEWGKHQGGTTWHFGGGNQCCHLSWDTKQDLVWMEQVHISFEKSVPVSQFGHGIEPRAGFDRPSTHFLQEISIAIPVWMSQRLVWVDQAHISFRNSVLPSQFGHGVEPRLVWVGETHISFRKPAPPPQSGWAKGRFG